MPAMFDDDDYLKDAEETVRASVEAERRRNELIREADQATRKLRDYMSAIVLARLEHIDTEPLENAATEYLLGLGAEVWWRMAWVMAFAGCPSAEDAANTEVQQWHRLQVRQKPDDPGRHRA